MTLPDLCAVCITQLFNSVSLGENAPEYRVIVTVPPFDTYTASRPDAVIKAMVQGWKFMVDSDVFTGRAVTTVSGTRVCPEHTADFMTLVMTKPGPYDMGFLRQRGI